MIKKLFSIALVTAAVNFTNAQSFSLLYPFTNCAPGIPAAPGVDPTPSPTATGVSANSFTALGIATGTFANSASGVFNWGGFPSGYSVTPNDTYTTMYGALSPTRYYGVSIAPAASYVISLTSMTFQASRNANGPRSWAVRSSLDGFSNNLPATYIPIGPAVTSPSAPLVSVLTGSASNTFFWKYGAVFSGTATPEGFASNNEFVITFGSSFSNLINPVTLGIFPWNSFGSSFVSSGTFRLDSVVINGTATFSLGVGLNKVSHDINAKIKLYPNPSNDGIVMIETTAKDYSKIEVINTLGSVVANQTSAINDEKIKLNLATLPIGTYFVRITTPLGVITEKLIITK